MILLTRLVLLPLGAADGGGKVVVSGKAVSSAVPLSPVVRVAAVADAFPAAGSRQGQRGTLAGNKDKSLQTADEE